MNEVPSHKIQIQTFEEFVSFLIVMGDCDSLWSAVDKSSLKIVLPISLHGKGCDGRVDIWGAEFLRSLQKELNWVLKEFGNVKFRGRDNTLRTKVSYGSDNDDADYTGIVKAMLNKMDGKQVTICAIMGMLLYTGYSIFAKWNENAIESMRIECQQAIELEHMHHEERIVNQLSKSNSQLVHEFNSSIESLATLVENMGKDPEKPIRNYIRSMRRGDLLAVGNGDRHTKEQAKEKLRERPEETVYCVKGDGKYILHGVELVGTMQGIRIDQGKHRVTALLERLDERIKNAILEAVDASMETQSGQEMSLQIDVYFTPNAGVHHAVVIGVGQPREGNCYRLEEIPQAADKRDWILQGEE